MSQAVTVAQAAAKLREAQDIVILTHQYPDGDTLGCGYALCRALKALGKRVRVECADDIPEKYDYLFEGIETEHFEPQYVVAVDVADDKLLGALKETYQNRIALCIDHHGSNTEYADSLLLKANYAAAAMVIFEVISEMGVSFDSAIAECLYTGIATDSGCFKYANADAYTHRMTADLMDIGIRAEMINRVMFDTKSRARVELERLALEGMRFYNDGRIAIMPITLDMVDKSHARENDMEGLAPLPRQIEGVWVGVTMREKENGEFKISLRTGTHADASQICKSLGGGGHIRAAGCSIAAPLDEAIEQILTAVRTIVENI